MSNLPLAEILSPISVSTLAAVAVGYTGWVIVSLIGKKELISADAASFEQERREELSQESSVYRNVQTLVFDLSRFNLHVFDRSSLKKLTHSLEMLGDAVPWKPEEFIAVKQVEGMLAGLVVGCLSLLQVQLLTAVCVALVIAVFYVMISVSSVHDQAKSRLHSIKMRLPFVTDLMALMIEAGATFGESLKTVVREYRDHPVGEELAAVDRQIELGRPRAEALRSFQQRFDDPDISEIIFAVNKGEELGTPLAKVLRNQADQMRLKRSQWGEKAAAEAQVKMAFPGMLVMIACVLVVLAPIVLPAIKAFSDS